MNKLQSLLLKHKFISIIIGILLFISGVLSRGQFVDDNILISFIIPLFLISLGFGFIFTPIFKKDDKVIYLFLKSVLAPWAIVVTIVLFNEMGMNSPVIRAGSLFLINIFFFNKEIGKALNI